MSEEEQRVGAIEVQVTGVDPQNKEATVELINEELKKFNEFIVQKGGAHPLVRAEAAMLRTYLLYKAQRSF